MSYLYHDDEAEFLDNGARPALLERDDEEAVYWREQCRKPAEGLRPFVWHGQGDTPGKESAS